MRRIAAILASAAIAVAGIGAAAAVDQVPPDVVATYATTMPRAALANDSFYFVMTDRYANGSAANDNGDPALAAGLAAGGFRPTDSGYFHGGDFKGLTANLARIKRLGMTAIWITPPFVNRAVQGSSAGYHGYWIVDFTRIDPHLGTEADFRAFMDKAHALGLKVYLDIVVNHTADVIQYRDGYGFAAAGTKQPFIPAGLEQAKSPAFLNDLANYHNQGSISDWGSVEQYQNGDFYGLDDIKTENAAVVDGFAKAYGDWITNYGIDGFRIDTAKHVDNQFFARWIPKLMEYVRAAGKTDFNMFGEVAVADPSFVSSFVRDRALPSVLDFPLQDSIVQYLRSGSAAALADTLSYDDFYNTGYNDSGFISNAYSLATFTGNHDMGRIGYLLGSSTSVAQVDLATALTYLLRGAPIVYYGDEVGMAGSGGDKAARQDMFPTKVSAWQSERRIGAKPIGKGSALTTAALANPIAKYITSLNALRSRFAALRDGALVLRSASGAVLAWSKFDSVDRHEFVLVANAGAKAARTTVKTSTPSSVFRAVLGKSVATASPSGGLTVTVPARSMLIMRADAVLPATTSAPALPVSAALVREVGGPVLTAGPTDTTDPITVTFIARSCATCTWTALGSDDAAPFQFVLPSSAWAGGDYLDVAAISRTSDGKAAVGAITHITHADVS